MLTRIAAVLAVFLAPAIAFGQALADRVPSDALVYVGWRGVADLGPAYPQSNLKAVLDECDVRQFIDEFIPAVMERIGQEDKQAAQVLPIIAKIARPTWQHPTAFFFAGVDFEKQPPVPHLGILWQPGADADSLTQQLRDLIGQVNPPFPVKVVHDGELVALVIGYDNADAALAGGSKSLAENSDFKLSLGKVMKDPAAAFYLDYEKLLEMVTKAAKANDPNAADVLEKVFKRLGVSNLKRVIATSGFDGKDWGTMAFVEAPEPRSGLLGMIGSKPIDNAIVSVIPATATMAGASRVDLSGLLPTIRDTLRDANPQAADQIDQMLKSLSQQSDVDIEKDLIGSLGDEWAYFTDPAIGGRGIASLTVVNRLKDPATFERSMVKMQDFALQQIEQQMGPADKVQIRFHTVKIDDLTVHYLAVPLVSPSWVVHNGMLYVSGFPQVAAAAARRGNSEDTSILKNPDFIALHDRLHHSGMTGFSFDDLPKTAPDAYGAWLVITHLAGFGDLFGVKSPPILLPELQKLQSHLSPAGAVKWVEADGVHMRSVEPFPGSTLVASDPAITALYAEPAFVGMALPAMQKAREQAGRVKSMNNLRQIGLAAIMYANAHQEQFPPDLPTLVEDQQLSAAVFMNPRSGHAAPPPDLHAGKNAAQWVKENSDYVYVGAGKKTNASPETIIAYEKPDNLGNGINIAFADGHVEFVEMPRAQEMIEKAKP